MLSERPTTRRHAESVASIGQPDTMSNLRVAIVHEKFTIDAGSERVVDQLHQIWPDAPIFCSVADPSTLSKHLVGADIRPHRLLQSLYPGGDRYAHLLPLLPIAAARRHLRGFDVVVTSHHQFANRLRADAPIVAYTHTPARWLWDASTRVDEIGGRFGHVALATFAATQRRADRAAAQRLHSIIANSTEVAGRVARWWGRESTVIAPPVDIEFFQPNEAPGVGHAPREDFFLLAGRLVPYKRPEIAVAAAARAGVRLVVAGDGRALAACQAVAGPTIEFVGAVTDEALRDYYQRCRALVYPGREDFGIMPVEAQACGAPVVALGAGGVLDTVKDGVTGVLYPPNADEISVLADVLRSFDDEHFDPVTTSLHAQRFGAPRFRAEMLAAVERAL